MPAAQRHVCFWGHNGHRGIGARRAAAVIAPETPAVGVQKVISPCLASCRLVKERLHSFGLDHRSGGGRSQKFDQRYRSLHLLGLRANGSCENKIELKFFGEGADQGRPAD